MIGSHDSQGQEALRKNYRTERLRKGSFKRDSSEKRIKRKKYDAECPYLLPFPRPPQKYTPGIDCLSSQGPYIKIPILWFFLLSVGCYEVKSNKKYHPIFGMHCANLLAYLWNRHDIYKKKGILAKSGWFWVQSSQIFRELGLSRKTIYSLLEELKKRNFVEVELRPPIKRRKGGSIRRVHWVKINRKIVMATVVQKYETWLEVG
jgi:hypothetical protein